MPLEVTLKPGDCIYIGTTKVVVRSSEYTRLAIEGTLPVLREGDYVELGESPSKARQLYVMLQASYMRGDFDRCQTEYAERASELLRSYPKSAFVVAAINSWLGRGNLYKALKAARPLADLD